MTPSPTIVDVGTPVREVAQKLGQQNIGGVIVCDSDRRPQGMVTDRDLAIQVVAKGRDPNEVTAGDLVGPSEMITIDADDSIELVVQTMKEHAVRRLPVIDGHEVIGIVSQADLASHADESLVGGLVEVISESTDNSAQG